ncbi:Peroxisomal membrane 22 kDa (Mpv17/PMP22) family protein [Trifolium repens]|nr:Peroxisomal membrane 22 kDa (Mpv17/PMP22) family protein [Trifolium repens]
MAKRLFLRGISNSIRQCTPHVRRYYPLNKPHDFLHRISHPSFSPTNKASFCSSSNSNSEKVGFVGWYLRKLENHPIITKSITSSLIFTAADLTSQMITLSSSASYDLKRTSRMAIYGGLILGPSQHMWFNFLSKILPNRDLATTLKKILMGQAVFGPVINTVFFSYNGALQGENGSEIIARLKRDLLPTLIGGALFWPVCDFVTFKYIPVHLQPLMNSSCAYVWTIYLSYMANRTNLIEA